MKRLLIAGRLLLGSFIPVLSPFWEKEDRLMVRNWFRGASYDDAFSNLEKAITLQLGDRWTVKLTNSGRAALQLALESLKLPPGSEVLLPSFSCTGVIMPAIQAGLTPVLVDVDEHFNIRFESVIEADSPNVKAVIVPHLSGLWAEDTEKIIHWAKMRRVYVIEDVAQAFGLKKNGRLAGTFGDVSIFSSGMGKPIFGPGGGWVISRDVKIAESLNSRGLSIERREIVASRLRHFLGRYSSSKSKQGAMMLKDIIISCLKRVLVKTATHEPSLAHYYFPMFSISDIETQLASRQIQKIERYIEICRNFAAQWHVLLSRLNFSSMRFLPVDNNTHSKMLISFYGKDGLIESKLLRTALHISGVMTEPSYTPLHLRQPFNRFRRTSMPYTEKQWKGAFYLPMHPNLNKNDWQRIERALDRIKIK